jgi:integrase
MLYRRAKSPFWWVRFQLDGREIRLSTRTTDRAQAEEFETQARNRAWRQARLGEKPTVLWESATKRWLTETQKRSKWRDEAIIAWFDEHLKGQPLSNITREVIEELRALKAEETSQSTANRHMALLRALLRKAAADWNVIEAAPKVPMYTIEQPEPRWITRAQFDRLAKKLPPHLRDMAQFTVATGLRMRNVTHLTWDRVDLKRRHVWIPGSRAKAGKPIAVPLNDDAIAILKRWKGQHEERVFVFRGKPVDDANGATFKAAAASVGLPELRWHDLRHTWASWHIQAGTPPHVLQDLGAWASYEMVRRYGHMSSAHLAKWAKKVQRRK